MFSGEYKMEALAGNLLQNEERSCHWSCSVKIVFLKISQNSKKTIFLIKLQAFRSVDVSKRDPKQLFF